MAGTSPPGGDALQVASRSRGAFVRPRSGVVGLAGFGKYGFDAFRYVSETLIGRRRESEELIPIFMA